MKFTDLGDKGAQFKLKEAAPPLVRGAAGLALGGIAAAGTPALMGIFGPVFGGWLLDFASRNYGPEHAFEVPFIAGGVLAGSAVILVLRMKETLIKVPPAKEV